MQRGDRVGLAMRNANAWCVSYLGILLAGGCATLLNGWWQGGELAAGIEDAEAKLVIADPQRAATTGIDPLTAATALREPRDDADLVVVAQAAAHLVAGPRLTDSFDRTDPGGTSR